MESRTTDANLHPESRTTDEYDEKHIKICQSEPVEKLKPFQIFYQPCIHSKFGVSISYYNSEYGFLTTIKDVICENCLKQE